MIQLVLGIIAGIGIDSGITLYAVRQIRKSQSEMAEQAIEKLSDGIVALAPQILSEMMNKNDESSD